jgi:hypothetical protein
MSLKAEPGWSACPDGIAKSVRPDLARPAEIADRTINRRLNHCQAPHTAPAYNLHASVAWSVPFHLPNAVRVVRIPPIEAGGPFAAIRRRRVLTHHHSARCRLPRGSLASALTPVLPSDGPDPPIIGDGPGSTKLVLAQLFHWAAISKASCGNIDQIDFAAVCGYVIQRPGLAPVLHQLPCSVRIAR